MDKKYYSYDIVLNGYLNKSFYKTIPSKLVTQTS